MKPILTLILLAIPARATLLATFETNRGNIVVELQHDKAPRTVANFMTLAQGTRTRLDQGGRIVRKPLFAGETFYRVVNESSFKIIQTGSGTGSNAGGPGYTLRDEFHPALTHVPYVLSMANAGPNTNGSQIFFTGNLTLSQFNNVYTVFGIVNDLPSRSTIDAVLAAGADGTTIQKVTFTRTDPAAVAFNEAAQGLPEVLQPPGQLEVQRGVAALWRFQNPMTAGDVFHVHRSSEPAAATWQELDSSGFHVGLGSTSPPTSLALDDAAAEKAFYRIALARHPDATAPSSLAGRLVSIPLGPNLLTYQFDATGVAGTTTYQPAGGSPIGGPFTLIDPNDGSPAGPTSTAHGVVFVTNHPSLNPQYLWWRIGCDSVGTSTISGRHSTLYYQGIFGWQNFGSGPATISR